MHAAYCRCSRATRVSRSNRRGTAARAYRPQGVTQMRGKWLECRGIQVMVSYHPSYLLRPYNQDAKREAWEDLKKVLRFVYD
ncbi:MAG: uracil-DNA glycosylase family protein [Bryobacteraceae bacterium]